MKATVKKIDGVRGFAPTTYAVYDMDVNTKCAPIIKIFMTKKEAEQFAAEVNAR